MWPDGFQLSQTGYLCFRKHCLHKHYYAVIMMSLAMLRADQSICTVAQSPHKESQRHWNIYCVFCWQFIGIMRKPRKRTYKEYKCSKVFSSDSSQYKTTSRHEITMFSKNQIRQLIYLVCLVFGVLLASGCEQRKPVPIDQSSSTTA